MFLYNILVGGSSKQQLPKSDKITFKINLDDNVPQFYECTPSESNKPYQFEEDQELSPTHPMYSKIIKYITSNHDNKGELQKGQLKQEFNQSEKGTIAHNNQNDTNEFKDENRVPSSKQSEQYLNIPAKQNLESSQLSSEFQSSEKHYHLYTVTQNDSLFGLALKLDIREQQIQRFNDIGSSLYPGMVPINLFQTIKLPLYCDVAKLYELPEEQLSKVKISELLGTETGTISETQKFDVEYYTGLAGYIKGTLSVNSNYIIFNPNLEDKQNLQNYSVEKLLKFNAIVETIDVQDIEFIDIPEMGDTESKIQNPDHNFIIQIFLYIVGNPKIEKKYKDRLTKLKAERKAIASISFSLRNYGKQGKQKCQQIVTQVKRIIEKYQEIDEESQEGMKKMQNFRDQKHLTNIPFFDIIHQNLHPKMKQQIESIVMSPQKQGFEQTKTTSVSPSLICGILTQTSEIISDAQFHNLSFSLPLLYQQCNWTRIYSSTTNGTSFTTFLNKARNEYPLILLVKEYKGWKFGAYLCQSLETGKTGRGEMFLFTFKNDSEVPDAYKWTTKNEFFVYIEKDSGIGIGMGVKYGLFIRNTMDKGSSSPTFTFGNTESLSKKEDFTVEEVQLWTIDNGY